MNHSINSLEWGYVWEYMGTTIGVIKGILRVETLNPNPETLNPIKGVSKGGTRSVDYSSHWLQVRF